MSRAFREEVRDRTVLLGGQNVDLRDILAQVHDDVFESDDELATALEALLARPFDEAEPEVPVIAIPGAEEAPGPAGA